MRHDGRKAEQLRNIEVQRNFTRMADGCYLFSAGNTVVLCTASIEARVPPWLADSGKGWVTAEYNMLPGSTSPRKSRDRGGKVDGRTTEIQRLIGRSLRAIVDLEALGEQMITVDCDVLQADGGTRTASITGAFMALIDAIDQLDPALEKSPIKDSVAAISVGVVDGQPVLDLDYKEDFAATVDMNVVMTGSGQYVEVQGTGEEATFSDEEFQQLLKLARSGISQLTAIQREQLGSSRW
ncbi:MAG: ribonuclease PH [Planctomycetaceae bacterium]|nr:ribonuclease PH [Planctomycetaceae bacterium]